MRPISHWQNVTGLRTHQNNRRFLRRIFFHRGVDLVLNNVLQTEINSQMNLIAVARRSFLPTIRHDFLASAVVFDEAKTILPMKIFLHRSFHSLDTTMVEVGESDDMAKHRGVWVNASGVVLEINSAQISGTKFFTQHASLRLGQFTLDD